MSWWNERRQFLRMAYLFEGGLVVLAVGLGWLVGVNPVAELHWSFSALVWGLVGALPLFALFLIFQRLTWRPLERMREFLVEVLGPMLAACRWYDIVLLALLAGVTEELLFRGTLQVWFERYWGRSGGLIASNILFGLGHFITPTYAIMAGIFGLYLGWLFDATGERNLLVPIVTHGFYDYLAFQAVVREFRRRQRPNSAENAQDEHSEFDSQNDGKENRLANL